MWRIDDSNSVVGYDYPGNGIPLVWHIQGVGDFDGDGHSDILWRNTQSGDIGIWLMSAPLAGSSGHTSGAVVASYPVVGYSTPAEWQIQGVGDVDGDRKSDIVWRDTSTGDVGIWHMNGGAVLDYWMPGWSIPSSWQIQAVGDIDGDHKADLVWRNASSGDVGVWHMNGGAVADYWNPGPGIDSSWRIKGVGRQLQ